MSHSRFDDLGNGRVKRGPENPEKCGALHAPLRLDSDCLPLVLPEWKMRRVEAMRNRWEAKEILR